MTVTLPRSRQTVPELLASCRAPRIMTELTQACEYGVKLTFLDEEGDLEVRTYYGLRGAWDRAKAENQLAAGTRIQKRWGIAVDAHLVTRYQGSSWAPAVA
ncbi:hypothetical protein [Streptosporangium sp. NPDC051022]|uniref:hypothetical protein n=1 Tax=Streptosporangium sp. NPDC051022 TaxID=3155752 RepID=UPI00342DB8CD